MNSARKDELYHLWLYSDCNDDYSWRDALTDEEEIAFVRELDKELERTERDLMLLERD